MMMLDCDFAMLMVLVYLNLTSLWNFYFTVIKDFSPHCLQCLNLPETHLHLFRDCPKASALWSVCFQWAKLDCFDYKCFWDLSWDAWINFNIGQGLLWNSLFAIIVWHIWRTRNHLVFESSSILPRITFQRLQLDLGIISNSLQINSRVVLDSEKKIVWIPPPHRYYKLNTDASWRKEESHAAGGGVVRDQLGLWFVGFAVRFMARSPLAAKLLALRQGLVLCREHGIQNLLVETDAQEIVAMINQPRRRRTPELDVIAADIVELMDRNWNVHLTWLRRDANILAHETANLAFELQEEKSIFMEPPAVLIPYYDADRAGLHASH